MEQSEAEIQRAIIDWLKWMNILHARVNMGGAIGNRNGEIFFRKNPMTGFPDLVIFLPGVIVFCEVKTAKGKLSDSQLKWKTDLQNLGFNYIVARSLQDVITAIKKP